MTSPAVFLDRDGTLNVEKDYLFRSEEWEWLPGVKEALKEFQKLGYRLVVVSNQSGVARGFYKEDDVHRLHRWVNQELAKDGLKIDGFYICPHAPAEKGGTCTCRKPSTELLTRAVRDLSIDLPGSVVIGDKVSDMEMAKRAGIPGLLVLTGYGAEEKGRVPPGTPVLSDLKAAVRWLKDRPL